MQHLFILLCLAWPGLPPVQGTTDLNDHHFQYVASHLTYEECRKLSESLHMMHYAMGHEVDGKLEPHVPCIHLLKHWARTEGARETVTVLALRLRQLGHLELAKKLSSIVASQIVEDVKKEFLENEFKLPETAVSDVTTPVAENVSKAEVQRWSGFHWMAVCVILMTVLVVILCVCYTVNPDLCRCTALKRNLREIKYHYFKRTYGDLPASVDPLTFDKMLL